MNVEIQAKAAQITILAADVTVKTMGIVTVIVKPSAWISTHVLYSGKLARAPGLIFA